MSEPEIALELQRGSTCNSLFSDLREEQRGGCSPSVATHSRRSQPTAGSLPSSDKFRRGCDGADRREGAAGADLIGSIPIHLYVYVL